MTFPLPLPAGTDTHYVKQLGATSYTANAVFFDSDVSLTSNSGLGIQSPKISWSFWFCMATYAPVHNLDFDFFGINLTSNADTGAVGISGQDDWAAENQFFFYWVAADDGNWISPLMPPNFVSNLVNNQWHHVLGSVDGTTQSWAVYIDDVCINNRMNFSGAAPPVTFDFGGVMSVPWQNTGGNQVNLSDMWVAPGVSLLDSNGLIPTATRRQFVSDHCQPVNPTGWPTSAVQLYGDYTTWTTNHGTGPNFTATGSLADTHAGSPSSGARVQIDGLKGGIYYIGATADDWTGTNLYILNYLYGFPVTRSALGANGWVNPALSPGSLSLQMYGPHPVDVLITRIHTTLANDGNKPLSMVITEDTEFFFDGGNGYMGSEFIVSCADWNSGSINFDILHPSGAWITLVSPTFNTANSVGTPRGTYRITGVASLGAPLAVSLGQVNANSVENYIFKGITELTAPFTLRGGTYGMSASCTDNTGAQVQFAQIMQDGSLIPRVWNNNTMSQPYLTSGTWQVDPTNLNAPLTFAISSMPTLIRPPADNQSLVLTDDTPFHLIGSPLIYQFALSCANWNSATITLQFLSPDGTWCAVNTGVTATANTMLFPFTGSGTYRFQGVTNLNAPLYVAIANTPIVATDGPFNFTINATTVEFDLAGGQYSLDYYHNESGTVFYINMQAPDGTWVQYNTFGDSPKAATLWEWFATGRYQIDASALDNPLQISITALPL